MSLRRFVILAATLALLLVRTTALAGQNAGKGPVAPATDYPTCNLPESDADALVILSNYYPGCWWDHTDLTIAVQAHPSATDEQLAAIHDAIATWSETLEACFDGLITLTDVTGTGNNPQQAADIVVHYYVPHAGGVVFGGYALCGEHDCPNILVTSEPTRAPGLSHMTRSISAG
jgi:hypothetical protein